MDNTTLTTINQEVYRRFPEIRGVKPRLQKLDRNILLIYQVKVNIPDEKVSNHTVALNRSIRVVLNDRYEILKISSSR
jgi:hypothetical protein